MKKEVRLYNVLFPIWMFFLFPTFAWLVILPINFAIDSLVLILALKFSKFHDILDIWKKSIWKIWIIGFLSDFVGAVIIYLIMLIIDSLNLGWNLVLFPGTTLISIPGVIIAGILIYFLNRKFSFKKCYLNAKEIHRYSLALAVFTAPYAMLIPLYG